MTRAEQLDEAIAETFREVREGIAETQQLLRELRDMAAAAHADRMALLSIVAKSRDVATQKALAAFLAQSADWAYGPIHGHA